MFVDTHAHLYHTDFDADREEVLLRTRQAGVDLVFLPNVDSRSIEPMLSLEAAHPGVCHAMMGLHPCSVSAGYADELHLVRTWLEKRPFCAIGEIGIDLYWDKTFRREQEEAFMQQVAWALELDLPIIIHSRESTGIILDLLEPIRQPRLRGIFHCFSGTAAEAQRVIALGFLLGIGGVLTFKKSGLDILLEDISLDHLVLETDAPYLAPVPYRGKRNESSWIPLVAAKLAEVKKIDLGIVAAQTTANARKLFGI